MARRRFLKPLLALAPIVASAACGFFSDPGDLTVEITPADPTLVLGETVGLTAELRVGPHSVTTLTEGVSWHSESPSVAAVSGDGTLTAVAAGTARVTAVYRGASASSVVTVRRLRFVELAAGGSHTCGRADEGSVFCWGSNGVGQLGSRDFTVFAIPELVRDLPTARQITAGHATTCAIADGAAWCWGEVPLDPALVGTGEQCPPGYGYVCHPAPEVVPGSRELDFARISTAQYHACGLTVAGGSYCWGANEHGQLGSGGYAARQAPGAVTGNAAFREVTAFGLRSCAVTGSGQVYCWGDRWGPSPMADTTGMPPTTTIALGQRHLCGLTAAGRAYCMGDTAAVAGGIAFAALTAGYEHVCALTAAGGEAYCWGRNDFGQAGIGAVYKFDAEAVDTGLRFTSLAAGYLHTCGLATDGLAYCWGLNDSGRLGDGSTQSSPVPRRVFGQ